MPFEPRNTLEHALVGELRYIETELSRCRRAQNILLDQLIEQGHSEMEAIALRAASKEYRALRRDENLYQQMWLRLTRRVEKIPFVESTGAKVVYTQTPVSRDAAPRNAQCPCGSGLKYKRCCLGKPAGPIPQAA